MNGITWILAFAVPLCTTFLVIYCIKVYIRPAQRKTSNINNSVGIKWLTWLRLGLSHLREYKFTHGFRDILSPLYPCSIEAETTTNYFLQYHFYIANRSTLMNDLNETGSSFSILKYNKFIDLILYGNNIFDDKKNRIILMPTMNFIKGSQIFDEHPT